MHPRRHSTIPSFSRSSTLNAVALALSGYLTFALMLLVAQAGDAGAWNRQLGVTCRTTLHRLAGPQGLDEARDIAALGSVPVMLVVALATAGFLRLSNRVGASRYLATVQLGGLIPIAAAMSLGGDARAEVINAQAFLSAVVYFSIAIVVAEFVFRGSRKTPLLCAAVGVVLLSGVARLGLGLGQPVSTMAGWSLGIGWVGTGWVVLKLIQSRERLALARELLRLPGTFFGRAA